MFSEATRCSNDILVSDNLRVSGFGYANDLVVHGKPDVNIQSFLHNLDSDSKMIELSTYIDETKVTANFAVKISLDGETIEQAALL